MERPLTRAILPGGEPLDIVGYERAGGYSALRKALKTMTPDGVIEEVKSARLRGRGGAGFLTGMKWGLMPKPEDSGHPRYLVANADEMEPGTFKDRLLLERNPHLLVEAVILSAYAIQADMAYVFVRGEYHLAIRRVAQAIAEAEGAGYIGPNILRSGFGLAIHIHASGGRYICGEETALLTALEGHRALPRAKPPFPQMSGLWGRPSIVNNVETLCNVPGIIDHGADWFLSLSRSPDGGTKLYGVSGRVTRPGVWELPLGTPLAEILEEHAGGMRVGYECRAVLPGGASTSFLMPESFNVAMDYASIEKAGSRLGTGTMIVLDQRRCPIGMLRNLEHFFAQESCGWCTPCRDGLPWTERLLAAIEAGEGEMEDLDHLARHVVFLGPGKTFCAHAPGAMAPLASGLKHFRQEFERHIREQRCPWNGQTEAWA